MKEENNTDMIFDCSPSNRWKENETDLWERLVEALGNDNVKQSNSQYRDKMDKYAGKTIKFMSKPIFHKWMNGKATTELHKEHHEIIDSYIEQYGIKQGSSIWSVLLKGVGYG